MPDVVFKGFDFLHCCVGLEVQEDLSYTYIMDEIVRACLKGRRLHFTEVAFAHKDAHQAIVKELRRLYIYSQRGFKW